MEPPHTPMQIIIAGRLFRDYILLSNGQPYLDIPGGSLLYAGSGAALWQTGIGLLGRADQSYPKSWLETITQKNLDRRGIRLISDPLEMRRFIAYDDQNQAQFDNPVSHFTHHNQPFPKALLDFRIDESSQVDSRIVLSPVAIRTGDIPQDYLNASAAHICPIDYLSHSLLPSVFRQGQINIITLDPASGYMNPTYWDSIPALLTGITAFLPNEQKIRGMFQGRSSDIWEMMEAVSAYGCDMVVVKRSEKGQYLYDARARIRYNIPAYPGKVIDPTGAGDAFCGGFVAGYRNAFDPLQAVLSGNISASFCVEGIGPFYTMEAMPRLAEARRLALKDMVHRI